MTKPDNTVSRELKKLLDSLPEETLRMTVATLGASLELAGAPQGSPGETPSRLGERHKLIVELQVERGWESASS